MERYIQIQWTAASLEEARKICMGLVEKRLVACASIIPQVESIYRWENKIHTSTEAKAYCKTSDGKFLEVQSYILENASYSVPEILKTYIDEGLPSYLQWIDENLK